MAKKVGLVVALLVMFVIPGLAPPASASSPSKPGFTPSERHPSAHPRLAPSLRDDLEAGRPVRPASATAGRVAGSRGSEVRVVVEAPTAALAADAVKAAGGVVTAPLQTMVEADVPAGSLGQLADAPGVVQVREPRRMRPTTISEGVAGIGADAWQTGGWTGTGVKVAILDVGFGGYAAKLGTELPANVETDLGRCSNPAATDHGTAVAEIVHDVAPNATLRLVCVEDDVDYVAALSTFQANGVQVVNASIGNDLSGRGDGSGGPDTPAGAVAALRERGILFVTAAGNSGTTHFHTNAVGGTAGTGSASIVPLTAHNTFNVTVPGNGSAYVAMRWDAWPRTTLDFDLHVGNTLCGEVGLGNGDQSGTPGGLEPVEWTDFTNCSSSPQTFEVVVQRYRGAGSPRLDLFFEGVSGVERATASSISDPAASPAALAVGAACQTADLEPYSSRGPTIDERVKPDIVGPDATSSSVYGPASGCGSGFRGTSAASPHVAGAAALLLGANPGLQVAEVQQLLEDWALDMGPVGKDNGTGSGRLHLQPEPSARPAAPQPFTPVSPIRLFDSRPGTPGAAEAEFGPSGRTTPVGAGAEVGVQVAGVAAVPADASAVLLNVTVTDPSTASFLTVYPGGARPNTSNLNYAARQVVATHVTATVGADRRVRLYNAAGTANVIVDIAGWYGPTGRAGPATARFTARSAPARAFDSRAAVGYAESGSGRTTKLASGEDLAVRVAGLGGIPATATGVIMNVTVTDPTAAGFLTVYPTGALRPLASNLNWGPGDTVANLVVGGVGTGGSVQLFGSGGPTHVIVDVIGWFEPNVGGGYVALDPPVRDLDSRFGNGPRLGPVGEGESHVLHVGGYYGVPTDAAAVMLGVIAVSPTKAGYLTVYPTGPRPLASNLNFVPGATVPNAVVAGLGTGGGVSFFNSTGATNVVSDLAGYFLDPANLPQPLAVPPPPPPPPPPPLPPPSNLSQWQPPAAQVSGTGTVLYLESDAGDYIGAGRTYRYTKADSVIDVTSSGADVNLRITGDQGWYGDFAGPGPTVQAGSYPGLHRFPFFNPGLSFYGEGRGCNELTGELIVDRALYQAGALNEVVLRFEQHCEGGTTALRGYLRFDADDTTAPPPPPPPSAFAWQPPAAQTVGTGTMLYTESDAGDFIGGGATHRSTKADTTFNVSASNGTLNVGLNGDTWWYLDVAEPSPYTAIATGAFQGVERYPFNNPLKGGLSFSGDGRGCNTLTGQFAVDRVLYQAGILKQIEVRFEQHCEGGGPALRGFFRYDADDPTVPPPPSPPSAFTWQPPAAATAGTGTVLYAQSDAGDYIGGGATYRYTKADAVFSVNAAGGHLGVGLRGNQDWTLDVVEPGSPPELIPAAFLGAMRYPFQNPTKGGLSFSGEGRGCNTLTGAFGVDRVLYQAGILKQIEVRFEQHCEGGGPALRGFFRYDADDPTQPAPPPPASTFTWQPPAGAVPATGSYLYFAGTSGDYISGGRTDLYTASATTSIGVGESSGVVNASVNRNSFASWWYLDFTGPDAQTTLQPGAYVNVQRYPFHNPSGGGFALYGEGRGCNAVLATFAVDDATYVNGVLQSVAIRFVQRCEGTGPPLYGACRWVRP